MMFSDSPTPYSSLPGMPHINALPGGVPYGPWGPIYRSAPGAQIPAVMYPGMMAHRGRGMAGAGFGRAPVQIVGALGQTEGAGALGGLLVAAAVSAGIGAVFAMAVRSKRPILNPALVAGGITLTSGLLGMAFLKAKTAKEETAATTPPAA